MDRAVKHLTHQFKKIFFNFSKCLACNAYRKNTAVEDNKKIMNIANFINIYTNIYIYIICDENDS